MKEQENIKNKLQSLEKSNSNSGINLNSKYNSFERKISQQIVD